jgi:death-on-curing protein
LQRGWSRIVTEYLSIFEILEIRARLAAETGDVFDILNLHGLKSALAAPRQSMFGEDLFPTVWDKAAALLFSLIQNHPFYDGNKRIALWAVDEFLRRNGWILLATPREKAQFTTAIAASQADIATIAQWLRENARLWDEKSSS